MSANATAQQPALGVLRFVALDELHDSPTQQRDVYDPDYIAELGTSIKAAGQNNSPVLARPNPNGPGFEIVFGHCRKRGCAWAGLTAAWTEIRDMTDMQVELAQISENLNRRGLDPLAEAQGFRALMQNHGLKAEDMKEKFGKSRSYVYASLSLLKLCEPVVAALSKGLPIGVAHKIAGYGSDSLQQRALQRVRNHDGSWLSERDAKKLLNNEFAIPLAEAPFSLAEEHLNQLQSAGPCSTCQKCSTNNTELAADLPANSCVDKDCFDIKCDEHWQHVVMQLQDDGHDVLQEEDAIRAFSVSGHVPLSMSFPFDGRAVKVSEIIQARPEGLEPAKLTYIAPDGEEPRGYIAAADLNALMEALGLRKAPAPPSNPTSTPAPAATWPNPDSDEEGEDDDEPARQHSHTEGWTDQECAVLTAGVMYQARTATIRRILDTPRNLEELRLMARREVEMADGDLGIISATLLDADEFSEAQMLAWVDQATPDQLSALLAAIAVDWVLTQSAHPFRRDVAQRRVRTLESYGVNVLDLIQPPAATPQPAPEQKTLDGVADDEADPDEDDDDEPPIVTKSPSKTPARYCNAATGETWSGRGLQPKWLKAAIAAGAKLSDFVV